MKRNYKPISGLTLFNTAWVFFFFGWILALIIDRYEVAGASTEKIETLIF